MGFLLDLFVDVPFSKEIGASRGDINRLFFDWFHAKKVFYETRVLVLRVVLRGLLGLYGYLLL